MRKELIAVVKPNTAPPDVTWLNLDSIEVMENSDRAGRARKPRVLAGRYPKGEVNFEFDSTNRTVLALDDFARGRLVEDGLDGRAIGP